MNAYSILDHLRDDPPTDATPLTACHAWWEMWLAIVDARDLRLSDTLGTFIDLTKTLIAFCETANLDPSPLVLFLSKSERVYAGVTAGVPNLNESLQVLLHRLELKFEQEAGTAASSGESAAVVLSSRNAEPMVRGKRKPPLTHTQYNVVTALVEAGDTGCTVDQLTIKSGHSDARGVLRRLAKSDPDWRAIIHFPGKPHGRYRIG